MPEKTPEISPREKQLLRGIAAARTYSEIAHDMKVSHETIKSYVARLRGKLGIRTKVGLALWATENLKD